MNIEEMTKVYSAKFLNISRAHKREDWMKFAIGHKFVLKSGKTRITQTSSFQAQSGATNKKTGNIQQ